MEKQIERNLKQINAICADVVDAVKANSHTGEAGYYVVTNPVNIAQDLYYKGYRKASEVAMEMFADFQCILFSIMYFGNDGKYHLRKISADKVTSIFEKYFELKKKYTEGGNEISK